MATTALRPPTQRQHRDPARDLEYAEDAENQIRIERNDRADHLELDVLLEQELRDEPFGDPKLQ